MKRLLTTALALALSGCALMEPGPEPVPALDATKLGLTGQNALWPADHWWQRYGDSQLDALVDEALANNPSMSSAQARLAQANAAVSTARSSLLPRVDANYTLNREHLSKQYIYPAPLGGSVVSDNRLALDFSYELDLWGKNRSRLKSAVSQQAASAADAQAARNLLASAVVRAYLNLQNGFAQRSVLKRVLAQRADVLELTRARYSYRPGHAGRGQAGGIVAGRGQGRTDAGRDHAGAAAQPVAALAGAGPQRGQSLTEATLVAPAGGVPASVPLDLLGRRPDVVAARWRAEAARHAIDTAKAEFYPNINLTAFAGFQAMGTGNLLDAASRMAGIGPAISLPIFHGGALNANLAGRRADADLAISDYNQSVLDAVRQVADALDGLRLLEQERGEQRQARAAIDAAYDLAVKRYKAGMGNYLSVLIAQTGVLTQARLDTDLRIRAYQLDADLAYALGGGYTPAAPDAQPAPAGATTH
ncbi:efflux transporter outer membrane subunit [Achromobacter xylosoxidans]